MKNNLKSLNKNVSTVDVEEYRKKENKKIK